MCSQPSGEEISDYRLQESLRARAAAEAAALQRHPLSPQSLLAASMASNPPSLVPLPGLGGLAGFGGAAGRSSVSPPAREAASPPSSSAAHSPRQPSSGNQASWNFEEQFKQVSSHRRLCHELNGGEMIGLMKPWNKGRVIVGLSEPTARAPAIVPAPLPVPLPQLPPAGTPGDYCGQLSWRQMQLQWRHASHQGVGPAAGTGNLPAPLPPPPRYQCRPPRRKTPRCPVLPDAAISPGAAVRSRHRPVKGSPVFTRAPLRWVYCRGIKGR